MRVSLRSMGRHSRHFALGNSARIFMVLAFSLSAHAVVVRGVVTDSLGAVVPGATLALMENGRVIVRTSTGADGSYELSCGDQGRFQVLVGAATFAGLKTTDFYGGRLDVVVRDLALQPAGVQQQVTVTATGTPTPQAQLSSSVSVIEGDELATRVGVTDELRQMPGVNVVQTGQNGGQTSLFVRGGQSDANKILVDGIPAEDIGGGFDFGPVSSTGIASVEVYRGPDSALYGSDANAGVVSIQTPRGATAKPVLNYTGDFGNFRSYRNEVTLGGEHRTLDYFLGYSRFDTSNALPEDEYHDGTPVANLGWSPTAATQVRFTLRYSASATGVPGPHDFYDLANDAKQADQDLYSGATVENRTSSNWHNLVRYAITRKRETEAEWFPTGNPLASCSFGYCSITYYGNPVTIHGANGYSASGQAVMNYGGASGLLYNQRSNRDEFQYQSDHSFTQHVTGFFSFRYENERGDFNYPAYSETEQTQRTNFEYTAQINGDAKNRFFYSVGGGVEKNHLDGLSFTPRFGLAWYPVRPGSGFRGTKVRFNFSKGIQEPSLYNEFYSLHNVLLQNGDPTDATRYPPVAPEQARTYEAGVDQDLFGQKLLFKVSYFHNELGRQFEFVSANELGKLFGLSPSVVNLLNNTNGGATANTLAYRAQGIETELQWRPFEHFYMRGGYTYLDTVTQRSFSGSVLNAAFYENPNIPGVLIGASSPLLGARAFRRPPHTGYFAMEYLHSKFLLGFKGVMSSRADDSTFLAYSDLYGGNTLLLPNRNLDYGYTKLDLNATYQWKPKINIFTQLDNLLGEQHIGPIGYPGLPFTFRLGVKVRFGKD